MFVYKDTPVWRAARAMQTNDCSFLPVVENGIALGVVTAEDLAYRIVGKPDNPITSPVSEIMSSPAFGLCCESSVEDAARLMRYRGVHRLILTDERGVLRGVISLGNLVGYLDSDTIAKTLLRLTETSGPGVPEASFSWLSTLDFEDQLGVTTRRLMT